MRPNNHILAILTLAFSALALAGCGGGGGGGGSSSNGTGTGGTVTPVVKPNVTVLPSDGSVTMTGQTDTSVTLSGSVPALSPGQVIVSGAGNGVLRKVVSTSTVGGSTVVQTQSAALTDLFQQADITLSKTLAPSDFSAVTPMLAGVRIGGQATGSSRSNATPKGLTATVPITFTNVGFPASNPAATLNGTGSLTLSFDTLISIRSGQLQTARWVPQLTGNLNLTITTETSQDFANVKIPLAHLVGDPILTTVGGIPVVFTPDLDVYATMGGNIKAGVSVASNASVTVGAGVEYNQGSGWHPVTSYAQTINLAPTLNSYATASFDATPLGVEFSVLIDDVAGPDLTLDLPKLNATLTAQTNPVTADVDVTGDFDGEAGFHVQILDLSADYTTPPLDYPFNIYHQTFTATNGTVNVGVN